MFDFLRNLTKSDEEKHQEMLTAYLDNALTPKERQQFEQQLAGDAALQAELSEMRAWRQQMRRLPRRRAPRNFTLDPVLYGRPRSEPLLQAYPVLRTATALVAVIFVFALAANFFLEDAGSDAGGQPVAMEALSAPMAAEESAASEAPLDVEELVVEEGETVEITRVVVEEVIVTSEIVEKARTAEEETAVQEAVPASAADAMIEGESELAVDEGFELLQEMEETATVLPESALEQPLKEFSPGPETAAQLPTETDLQESPASAPTRVASFYPLLLIGLGFLLLLLVLLTWLARRRM